MLLAYVRFLQPRHRTTRALQTWVSASRDNWRIRPGHRARPRTRCKHRVGVSHLGVPDRAVVGPAPVRPRVIGPFSP